MGKIQINEKAEQEEWDGLHRPQIYYAMFATFCGLFLAVLDGTICTVALPTIATELGVSSSDSIWVVNAFQLVVMMTLLPFASAGEQWGYKRVYLNGIIVFTLGSLSCALATTLPLLVAARVFQGIGAAMLMSINTSLVKLIYPKRHLGKGMGLNATMIALAAVTGPNLAAAILSVATWPYLFAVNVPIGIVTYIVSRKYLPENPDKEKCKRRFKRREAFLNVAFFGLLIGCIEGVSHGLSAMPVLIGVSALLVIGYLYIKMQLKEEEPMFPFDLLKIPAFFMSVTNSTLAFMAQTLGMVSIPFLLVSALGYNAVETGLTMTAWPLIIIFVSPLSGWLIGKVNPGVLGGTGLAVMCAGCICLSFLPAEAGYYGVAGRLMLGGAGFGLFLSPNNHLLMTTPPPGRSGSASGMLATARLVGQTTGAALAALMFHFWGDTAPHSALLLSAGLSLAGVVISFFLSKAVS